MAESLSAALDKIYKNSNEIKTDRWVTANINYWLNQPKIKDYAVWTEEDELSTLPFGYGWEVHDPDCNCRGCTRNDDFHFQRFYEEDD